MVQPTGPHIAEGRDSVIFAHGRDKVLRIARDGRSLTAEAEIMLHVRAHGYPCPRVYDAGDGFLLMDRLDGLTMMEAMARPPFRLRRSGRLLAELHERLHRIPAPAGARVAALQGDRLLHGDLHPMNVMLTSQGPMVIDWSNATVGDPALDVADTWLVLACGSPPAGGIERLVVPIGRRVVLRAFLSGVDLAAARQALPLAVEGRLRDRNLSPDEQQRMARFVAARGAA